MRDKALSHQTGISHRRVAYGDDRMVLHSRSDREGTAGASVKG
jgi:hypothetical protein